MFIKQLPLFVDNKSGRPAEITSITAAAGIDIRALSIADTTNFGILRIIVDKPDQAEKILRDAGLTVSLTNVIAIGIPDVPGGFAGAMKALSDAGISVEYMYAFLTPADDDRACIIMCTSDGERAVRLLREKGITILSGDEIYTL